ncbi:MAG TPA: Uma2 family endonuclease [Pirellulales bacterium]|jgi:Uma2 family endonuclease
MQKTAVMLSPADHGRRMSLAEFENAISENGTLYELNRGVIEMINVPGRRHFALVNAVRRQLAGYDVANPGAIYGIASGSDCKILIESLESERHPDVAVYKSLPPSGADYWSRWIPEVVIEVVSPRGEDRDYVEKREEYLKFGIQEYWIVDGERRVLIVLVRQGDQWEERRIHPPEKYASISLPGFELDCAAVFAAADSVGG